MSTPVSQFEKYGEKWKANTDPLWIELYAIAKDGNWKNKEGQACGLGLFEHMMNARELLWPERYRHRWTELMYRNFIDNDITVLMGCASSQKTSHAVEFGLINYFARPNKTLVVLSTVNLDKADIGVYAELKMLWEGAKKKHDWLPGKLLEYKRAITTESEEKSRDFRKGIITRPCYKGGKWVGLGVLAGVKQEHIIYVADELQFMQDSFSLSWPHLFVNGRVKVIGAGNPKHDPEDQLAITAEPKGGWASHPEPQKTEVWETKFTGGRCINLVGTDSPNFDVADGVKPPFPGLINRNFEKRLAKDYGLNSFEYYRLAKGVMRVAFAHSRVITRQLCREHHALETAVWFDNTPRKKVYALDPTYGGDDRCVGMALEWGAGVDGKVLIRVMGYRVFPFRLDIQKEAEVQIADTLEEELQQYGIPSTDCFYDSVGKGTLAGPFAIKFREKAPIAVDSGAQPTTRPVRADLWVDELDGSHRPKECWEHYSKFVTEMWMSTRYAIEAEQVRELPEEVMVEGCARIYEIVAGNKIQVEPKSDPRKKEDLKRRLGKSPDLYDTFAIGIEGARQRGFVIDRLGDKAEGSADGDDFFGAEAREYRDAIKRKLLVHR